MKTVIKKHLDVEKIERIAREKKYEKEIYEFFLSEIEKLLIKELHIGFTDKSGDSIISNVVEFITEIEVLRKKGYGIEWAVEYVRRIHSPEKVHAAALAYLAAENAKEYIEYKNLELYAKLTGRDENFVEFFSMLLVEPDYHEIFVLPIEETADNYSNTIKKLMVEGRSKLYAKYYAFFSATNEFPPYRCHIAGMEAERADEEEIEDLIDYAEDMSGYIYDNFDVYEDSLTDDKVNEMRKKYAEY